MTGLSTVAVIGMVGGLAAPILSVAIIIAVQLSSLRGRFRWKDNATATAKLRVYVLYVYHETDWRAVGIHAIPRAAAIGFVSSILLAIFAVGLAEVVA